jgi:hypothetical protein
LTASDGVSLEKMVWGIAWRYQCTFPSPQYFFYFFFFFFFCIKPFNILQRMYLTGESAHACGIPMQAFQTVEPVATEKEDIACASLCSVRISQSLGAEAGWLAGWLPCMDDADDPAARRIQI